MTGKDKARELIQLFASGVLTHKEFVERMGRLDEGEIDLTVIEDDEAEDDIEIRARASADRLRRIR